MSQILPILMDTFNVKTFSKTILVQLPSELRNKNWSEYFGKIQQELRHLKDDKEEIIVDASKCVWADPLPLLSLIISLAEVNSQITKKFILPDILDSPQEQKGFLAFLNKEGFLDNLIKHKIALFTNSNKDEEYRPVDKDDIKTIEEYEKYIAYYDSSILKAQVVNLSNGDVQNAGIDHFIDDQLTQVRHRFQTKIQGVSERETFNKVALFLKETIENVYEHAYKTIKDGDDYAYKYDYRSKMVGYYIRCRHGLADNSLDSFSRKKLIELINKEHDNSPRLLKWFLENISGFIEIFVIDAGIGLTKNYNKDIEGTNQFRDVWRDTIGLGKRGATSPRKNTEFGGLYTLNRLCINNYLVGRDENEWLGDLLPVIGTNPEMDANKSYLTITSEKQIEGLALIGRISWKSITDDTSSWLKLSYDQQKADSNVYINAIKETKDIYLKYYGSHYDKIIQKPIYVIDGRFNIEDNDLKKSYLAHKESCDFLLLLPPERLAKNKILELIVDTISTTTIINKSVIIADIAVWEASTYQLALENAQYSTLSLSKIDKIVLITRRLNVCILSRTANTFSFNKALSATFIQNVPARFLPDCSLSQCVELLRTHDSMIFWQKIKNLNKYGEYFINEDIAWYQDSQDIGLKGYLNFSKTLTEKFCTQIYEYSLERTLCLSNEYGCKYNSIDLLTSKIAMQYNTLFYNKSDSRSIIILLGSVFVSGFSEKASEIGQTYQSSYYKIHFFHNQNVKYKDNIPSVPQLLLWPLKGESWIKGNLKSKEGIGEPYRRVGTSYVIAPYGWKYFPIPRYKLFDKIQRKFLNEYSLDQVNSPNYEFRSIYKCSPNETYSDWQGKRTRVLNIGHICYESAHDLLNIDFPFVIKESFMTGGKLSQFLVAEFLHALGHDEKDIVNTGNERLINGVKDYLNKEYSDNTLREEECAALIVYPFHFNSDYIISIVKENINPQLHDRIIALLPVKKERAETTFLIDPLTIESIRKKIKDFKSNYSRRDINILLFDDAVIRGKTRTEIKHILFSLGAKIVRTISILERRRLPFNSSDPAYNKAYWRLDIPKLGNSDTCVICNSLRTIRGIKSIIASSNILNRIKEILEIWKETTPFEQPENSLITPIRIDHAETNLTKKFGIYFDGKTHEQCGGEKNLIEISNSLGLSIFISEIHSMTSRDDMIFQYTSDTKINDYVKVEILSTYLLLFGKELSNVLLLKIIKSLFQLANSLETCVHTAYSLIALLSQRPERLEILYDICKDPGESDIKLTNQDMQILCLILSVESTSKFSTSKSLKRLRNVYRNLKDLYKQFHSEIYNDYGIAHDTPLQLIVREEYSMKLIKEAEDTCDKLIFLLKEIPSWFFRVIQDDKHLANEIEEAINKIKLYKEESSNHTIGGNNKDATQLHTLAKSMFEVLIPIHDKLFISIGLRSAKFPLRECIENLIKDNGNVSLSIEFRKLPVDEKLLQLERWITWDRYIERKLSYLISNTDKASYRISDPFNNSSDKKKGWISLQYFENRNYLEISIYNKSDIPAAEVKELTSKKIKPEKLHLIEHEIITDYIDETIHGDVLLKTIVRFPYI